MTGSMGGVQEAATKSAQEAEAALAAAREEVDSWRSKAYDLRTKVAPLIVDMHKFPAVS